MATLHSATPTKEQFMKEIIAKRSKSNYLIMLAISVFAVLICVINLLTQYNMKTLYIIGICVFGLSTIVWLLFVILPGTAITKVDNQLVMHVGLFKKAGIKISQIVDVALTPDPKNPNQQLGDSITIKYVIKKKHGQIDCGNLIDASAVVEKIKGLLGR